MNLPLFPAVKSKSKDPQKSKASKLKEIALSADNTYSERMRAIDLLGELKEKAYDELAEIAANGLSYNERMNAIGLLEKIFK